VKNSELPGLTEAKPTSEDDLQTAVENPRNAPAVSYSSNTNNEVFFGTNQMNQIGSTSNSLAASHTNYVGTNVAITSTTATNAVKPTTTGKKPSPPFDPMLDETEHILLDYISLLGKNSPLIANQ
jgi:hypothetical protein